MPNTDIRVQVTFPAHWKTKMLERLVGDAGPKCLVYLWCYAGVNKPKGDFTGMTDGKIEAAAYWEGEVGTFISALLESEYLEGEKDKRKLHDWKEHNGWCYGFDARSERNRNNRLGVVKKKRKVVKEIAKSHGDGNGNGDGNGEVTDGIGKEPPIPPTYLKNFIEEILPDQKFNIPQLQKQILALGFLVKDYGEDEVFAVLRWMRQDTEVRGNWKGWSAVFNSITRLRESGCQKYLNARGQYLAKTKEVIKPHHEYGT